MEIISHDYSYKGLAFQIFSDEEGRNGKLALEEIVRVLLKLSNDNRDPQQVAHQQLQQTKVETLEYKGRHLVTPNAMLDFYVDGTYLLTDSNTKEYEELAQCLANQISYILHRNLLRKNLGPHFN